VEIGEKMMDKDARRRAEEKWSKGIIKGTENRALWRFGQG
jgi:hypothetical protein